MKFQPGNDGGRGRPRGSRNRLAADVFRDVLAHWNEPVKEGSELTRGRAALQMMFRERPGDYVRSVLSILPREFVFENVVTELADEELDRMIEMLRERALAAREEKALDDASQMKSVSHVPH